MERVAKTRQRASYWLVLRISCLLHCYDERVEIFDGAALDVLLGITRRFPLVFLGQRGRFPVESSRQRPARRRRRWALDS
jgi:hypothetical protein